MQTALNIIKDLQEALLLELDRLGSDKGLLRMSVVKQLARCGEAIGTLQVRVDQECGQVKSDPFVPIPQSITNRLACQGLTVARMLTASVHPVDYQEATRICKEMIELDKNERTRSSD